MRIHIGCSDRILTGWVNLDISNHFYEKDEKTDTVTGFGDARCLDYPENSIDEIYASHILDHISRKELDDTLSNWYSVLKPGGILRLAVSDFGKVVEMYNAGMGLEQLWGHIVGGHKTEHDKHGCVFDFKLLKEYLEKHGFTDVKRYDWRDFLPKGFDDLSRCYIPHMNFSGILMSLNVTSYKTILKKPEV